MTNAMAPTSAISGLLASVVPAGGTSAGHISPGDTAWMLVATALVLMMTPALGLFYSGLRDRGRGRAGSAVRNSR